MVKKKEKKGWSQSLLVLADRVLQFDVILVTLWDDLDLYDSNIERSVLSSPLAHLGVNYSLKVLTIWNFWTLSSSNIVIPLIWGFPEDRINSLIHRDQHVVQCQTKRKNIHFFCIVRNFSWLNFRSLAINKNKLFSTIQPKVPRPVSVGSWIPKNEILVDISKSTNFATVLSLLIKMFPGLTSRWTMIGLQEWR